VKKFGYRVQKGNAGANLKKFKFEIGITGYPRGYRVTGCPDVFGTFRFIVGIFCLMLLVFIFIVGFFF
jgi:hypothetical protein